MFCEILEPLVELQTVMDHRHFLTSYGANCLLEGAHPLCNPQNLRNPNVTIVNCHIISGCCIH